MGTPLYEKRPTSELAHFAWCLLVALRIEQQYGKSLSGLLEHLFIMRWLTNAQKRKLFSRSIAPDIHWLLSQGKRYGLGANLLKKNKLYLSLKFW
ncbi:DUF2913 family protein [Serratia ficaria]|uniref:DUF2913 family protein n=1 Tax=Serratia ficaria TaxID=61651 RepID=UPI0021C87E09|nr:DUF2913 family protein [Serratia ficaria]